MKKGVWGIPMVMMGIITIMGEILWAVLRTNLFQLREFGFLAFVIILEIIMLTAGIKLLEKTRIIGPIFCVTLTYLFSCRVWSIPLKEMDWIVLVCSAIFVFGLTIVTWFTLSIRR